MNCWKPNDNINAPNLERESRESVSVSRRSRNASMEKCHELERQEATISSALEVLEKGEAHLIDLKRDYNNTLDHLHRITTAFSKRGFESIPVEILTEIFLYTSYFELDNLASRAQMNRPTSFDLICHQGEGPLVLLGVCRLWDQVVFSTPTLWNRIIFSQSDPQALEKLEIFLHFSAQKPLHIQIFLIDSINSIDLLQNHYRRIETLFLTIMYDFGPRNHDLPVLNGIISSGSKNSMKHLNFEIDFFARPRIPFDLSAFPHLEIVEYSNLDLDLNKITSDIPLRQLTATGYFLGRGILRYPEILRNLTDLRIQQRFDADHESQQLLLSFFPTCAATSVDISVTIPSFEALNQLFLSIYKAPKLRNLTLSLDGHSYPEDSLPLAQVSKLDFVDYSVKSESRSPIETIRLLCIYFPQRLSPHISSFIQQLDKLRTLIFSIVGLQVWSGLSQIIEMTAVLPGLESLSILDETINQSRTLPPQESFDNDHPLIFRGLQHIHLKIHPIELPIFLNHRYPSIQTFNWHSHHAEFSGDGGLFLKWLSDALKRFLGSLFTLKSLKISAKCAITFEVPLILQLEELDLSGCDLEIISPNLRRLYLDVVVLPCSLIQRGMLETTSFNNVTQLTLTWAVERTESPKPTMDAMRVAANLLQLRVIKLLGDGVIRDYTLPIDCLVDCLSSSRSAFSFPLLQEIRSHFYPKDWEPFIRAISGRTPFFNALRDDKKTSSPAWVCYFPYLPHPDILEPLRLAIAGKLPEYRQMRRHMRCLGELKQNCHNCMRTGWTCFDGYQYCPRHNYKSWIQITA